MSERFAPVALALGHHAASRLGWRPHEFWAATPAELGMALVAPADPAAIDRATLRALFGERFEETPS